MGLWRMAGRRKPLLVSREAKASARIERCPQRGGPLKAKGSGPGVVGLCWGWTARKSTTRARGSVAGRYVVNSGCPGHVFPMALVPHDATFQGGLGSAVFGIPAICFWWELSQPREVLSGSATAAAIPVEFPARPPRVPQISICADAHGKLSFCHAVCATFQYDPSRVLPRTAACASSIRRQGKSGGRFR